MGYSLCIEATFGHFQNALTFRILAVFFELFFPGKLICLQKRFSHGLGKFIFSHNLSICIRYSLCILVISGHLQNALIFRILAVFLSRFLHRTTLMCL